MKRNNPRAADRDTQGPVEVPVSPYASSATYPDTKALADAINGSDVNVRGYAHPFAILQRARWVQESSALMELLRCRDGRSREFDLLCKYGGRYIWGADSRLTRVSRGGVEYEALVYQRLLGGSDGPPQYFGKAIEPGAGSVWLFLEHVTGTSRLAKSYDWHSHMTAAAEWIGAFHRSHHLGVGESPPDWMLVQDESYLQGCLERATGSWIPRGREYRWLDALNSTFGGWGPLYLEGQPAVIHGEYYPKNILVKEGRLCPVDWESTAIGLGEVDVLTLTENWSDEVEEMCLSAYVGSRYGGITPPDFDTKVNLARMYVQLRWLGEPSRPYEDYRLPTLRQAAGKLGLLA